MPVFWVEGQSSYCYTSYTHIHILCKLDYICSRLFWIKVHDVLSGLQVRDRQHYRGEVSDGPLGSTLGLYELL